MEVRKTSLLITLLFITFLPLLSAGQVPVKGYGIKDGNIYIQLSRDLSEEALDSFIAQYNLHGLPLHELIESGKFDSLQKLGWKLELNNSEMCAISKPLMSSKDFADPGKKIIYTQKQPANAPSFPRESPNLIYGANRFSKNKYPFTVQGSEVTFFLRGYLQSKRVMLAGSFNDWNPEALSMTRTDSGWIAKVRLLGGKYWYKFIDDGNWMVDGDNLNQENDGFGNINSIYYQPNITFRLDSFENAKKVVLTGSFNSWKENELVMMKTAGGWMLSIYLAQGTHTYKYIVDGRFHTDPVNFNRLPDGKGGYNSVLNLGSSYTFKLKGFTSARQVILSGTFNNWRENELQMKRTADGWELPYILRPGNYEYKFIVDGNWVTDPANPLSIDNDEGSKNSFISVGPNHTFRLKAYPNAKTVYLSGDISRWSPNAIPMKREGSEWVASVYLSPGKHKYKFVVDGEWVMDPANKLWEQNEYGTGNSVIWISK